MPFPNRVTNNGNIVFGGEAPAFMAPPNQGFSLGGNTRYFPCIDQTALVIRMNKSTDAGVNWAEKDAANAPAVPADGSGGTGFTEVYQFIGAALDPVSKIVYSAYFDPGTFNLALAPFNTVTDKWLPAIISTLTYLPGPIGPQFFTNGSFAVAFRPTDNSVWVVFYAGALSIIDCATAWAAKCVVTGAGTGVWAVALQRIGGTLNDGVEYCQGGIGVDPATGDIHLWILRHYTGTGAAAHLTVDGSSNINGYVIDTAGAGFLAGNIPLNGTPSHPPGAVHAICSVDGGGITSLDITNWLGQPWNPLTQSLVIGASPANADLLHYVIKPDDSLVGPQLVAHDSLQILQSSAIRFGANGTMVSTFTSGPNLGGLRHVLRALVGDAPTWEDLTPAAIQTPAALVNLLSALHRDSDGLDYVFYAFSSANGVEYHYATSKGIGFDFTADTVIGIVPPSDPNSAGRSVVAMSFNPLAITFEYGDGVNFGAVGMGWFELALAEPPPFLTLTFKGYKVYPR